MQRIPIHIKFMNYVYAVMWLIIGIYLCFFVGKANKLIVFLSFYFFFSAAWWFIDAATPLDLFVKPYSWVFRAISAVVLIIAIVGYVLQRKRLSAQVAEAEKASAENRKTSEHEPTAEN